MTNQIVLKKTIDVITLTYISGNPKPFYKERLITGFGAHNVQQYEILYHFIIIIRFEWLSINATLPYSLAVLATQESDSIYFYYIKLFSAWIKEARSDIKRTVAVENGIQVDAHDPVTPLPDIAESSPAEVVSYRFVLKNLFGFLPEPNGTPFIGQFYYKSVVFGK